MNPMNNNVLQSYHYKTDDSIIAMFMGPTIGCHKLN